MCATPAGLRRHAQAWQKVRFHVGTCTHMNAIKKPS